MEIREITPNILFGDTDGHGPNILFIHTSAGVVLVDTMMTSESIQDALDLANLTPADISLLITTHADPDHIFGNSLFDCPNIAHKFTYDRMVGMDRPAAELPTETFEGEKHVIEFGGVQIEMHHVGGHRNDMTMIWLPQEKVLLASDIIFKGRYPFMVGSDIPTWIEILKSLSDYPAEVVLPGHGTICTQADIDLLIDYMETTWQLVNQYAKEGQTLEDILSAPEMPKVAEWGTEDFFERNIAFIYEQVK